MIDIKKEKLINELFDKYPEEVLKDNSFPLAYFSDIKNVKAIVLGCDPSNSYSRNLRFAFGIESENPKFKLFFSGIESNLVMIKLSKETIYVQNLCQNYFLNETSNNSIWKNAARLWIPLLKEELSVFPSSIPVLLTSAYLYDVLKKGKKFKPIDYYDCKQPLPIPSAENELDRPLIPFYRNRRINDYHLSNPAWEEYKNNLIKMLHDN